VERLLIVLALERPGGLIGVREEAQRHHARPLLGTAVDQFLVPHDRDRAPDRHLGRLEGAHRYPAASISSGEAFASAPHEGISV